MKRSKASSEADNYEGNDVEEQAVPNTKDDLAVESNEGLVCVRAGRLWEQKLNCTSLDEKKSFILH